MLGNPKVEILVPGDPIPEELLTLEEQIGDLNARADRVAEGIAELNELAARKKRNAKIWSWARRGLFIIGVGAYAFFRDSSDTVEAPIVPEKEPLNQCALYGAFSEALLKENGVIHIGEDINGYCFFTTDVETSTSCVVSDEFRQIFEPISAVYARERVLFQTQQDKTCFAIKMN